jgi:hypothetical protein
MHSRKSLSFSSTGDPGGYDQLRQELAFLGRWGAPVPYPEAKRKHAVAPKEQKYSRLRYALWWAWTLLVDWSEP